MRPPDLHQLRDLARTGKGSLPRARRSVESMEGAPVRIMSHQRLWRDLLLADWSVEDIAEGYGVTARTVRETVAQP